MASPPSLPVLIVEDDRPTQRLLATLIQRSGHAAEIASNGAEAIRLLEARDYAAVVLDLMMPTVGGHSVVEFLAARNSRIPVIVCSAAGPSELAGLDTAVVRSVIRKPFDLDHFSAALTAATSGEPGGSRG